jgi:hypothetical protein
VTEGAGAAAARTPWRTWEAYGARLGRRAALDRGGDPDVICRALDELPEVSALEALDANRRLIEDLTGRRWYVMRAARGEGASWAEIGAALGMSKQGAHDWYRRTIAQRAEPATGLRDTDPARAAR